MKTRTLIITFDAAEMSNSVIAEILTTVGRFTNEVSVMLAENLEQLQEGPLEHPVPQIDDIPEELKASIIYIGGIQDSIKQDIHIASRYFQDSRFRTALEILMRNQYLFNHPRVANAFKDAHISKTKLSQLSSVYSELLSV